MIITGMERWLQVGPQVAELDASLRYGLVAHPASIGRDGRHFLECAADSPAPLPARLFAPEHGLWGHEQDMEGVDDGVDPWTGLDVVSLYGSSADSLRPTVAALDGLQAVVVDLQDIGSRYYTFIYTMAYVMEACGELGIPVVVLDRPNPIDGLRVEGPILEPGWESFVGRFPLPVRHGMTSGELAGYFRDHCGCECDLRVVEMRGWSRKLRFNETELPWAPPSPNMPAMSTALVYPGGCLIEGCELSEGRGTTLPFELIGSPTLDAREMAARLRGKSLPGVTFRAASFRPMFQKHAGRGCFGVQVIVENHRDFMPFECYLEILATARELDPEFAWREKTYEFESDRLAIDLLCGNDWIRAGLESGAEVESLAQRWRPALAEFMERREAQLLYAAD